MLSHVMQKHHGVSSIIVTLNTKDAFSYTSHRIPPPYILCRWGRQRRSYALST